MNKWIFSLVICLVLGCVVPPNHIEPTPAPNPVTPVVPPTPILQKKGLWVCIIEETADRHKLPVSQLVILTGKKFREWVATKEVAGKKVQFRLLDATGDSSQLEDVWKEALQLPRTSLPWINISNGAEGISCPLPKTEEETITLLNKYSQTKNQLFWSIVC